MPFVVLIFFWIIYLGFLVYDRCLLTQDLYFMVLEESGKYNLDNEQIYQNVFQREENWDWDKYAAFAREDPEIEVGKGKVGITVKGTVLTPFRFPFLKKDLWNLQVKQQSERVNPKAVMRSWKMLKEALSSDGGTESGKGNCKESQ